MKSIFRPLAAVLPTALVCLAIVSCGKNQTTAPSVPEMKLRLVSGIALPFSGASGIAYSRSLQKLWIISGGSHIYKFDMRGNVEKKLAFTGTDMEGIVFDQSDSTLWTIDELTKEITHLDLEGTVLSARQIVYTTKSNKGPEGITIGQDHAFYILNERDPTLLLKLDSQLSAIHAFELNFALDYSDVYYNGADSIFYILSDESSAFFAWSETKGVSTRFPLVNSGNEGIAYDPLRKLFYITNKNTDSLYTYAVE